MLDFARLKAPAGHGEVLVVPEPKQLVALARENRARLDQCRAQIAGVEIRELRRWTRLRHAGDEQRLVIVTGHQPEFMHAGVWVKHVVTQRLAGALGGAAINLVVDNDAPTSTDLLAPARRRIYVELRRVATTPLPPGQPYENLRPLAEDELARFALEVVEAMPEHLKSSMIVLFEVALHSASDSLDWVVQMLTGRQAVEEELGVQVRDIRMRDAWWSPLLAELLLNARSFAEKYNAALAGYRRVHKIRGAARPVPNLLIERNRIELPLWAYRSDGPRLRVFSEFRADQVILLAGQDRILEFPRAQLNTAEDIVRQLEQTSGWRIRPRALTLTLWARLLLADLFIHGIGGAKYDRITDQIIREYFGIEPPEMGCVTATMRLKVAGHPQRDLPETAMETVRQKKQGLRRLIWNPQLGDDHLPGFEQLKMERQELVQTSVALRERTPHDHLARRDVFRRLRNVTEALRESRGRDLEKARDELRIAEKRAAEAKIAHSREYFFALHSRAELERLLAALPGERDFAV